MKQNVKDLNLGMMYLGDWTFASHVEEPKKTQKERYHYYFKILWIGQECYLNILNMILTKMIFFNPNKMYSILEYIFVYIEFSFKFPTNLWWIFYVIERKLYKYML